MLDARYEKPESRNEKLETSIESNPTKARPLLTDFA